MGSSGTRVSHLSTGSPVPATAGGARIVDGGALFPYAEVSAVTFADGTRAVDLVIVGAADGGVSLTPWEARRLAAALVERADAVELGLS